MTTTRPRAGRAFASPGRHGMASMGPGTSPAISPISPLGIHALYALSGVTALVYEVAWTRLLTLELGHTVAAASTVLAAFMGGLAAGALAGGRVATRLSPPTALRAYAILEFGIAAFALVLPWLLPLVHPLVSVAYADGAGGALFQLSRLGASLAMVGIPAAAMGATYPLIVRASGVASTSAASLYAANTAGAAIGAVGAGFVLLRTLGISGTTACGAAGNLLVALIALRLTPHEEARAPAKTQRTASAVASGARPAALVAAATSGFVALLLEVAWARMLALIMGPTTYAFSAMVACFITGLAIGSTAGSAITRRVVKPEPWLAAFFALASLTTALSMMLVDDALLAVAGRAADPDARLAPMLAVGIPWAAALTVPTAFCFGALFPLALAAAGAASPRIAAHVYGANTIGAIAGALAGGLLIVPNVGVRGTFLSAIAVTIAAAAGAALLLGRRSIRPTVAALSLCVLAAAMSFRQSWNPKLLSSGAYKYAAYLGTGHLRDLLQAGTLLYYREGATGTVAVRDLTGVRSLSIDGKVDASNGRDMLTQRMLAHLPLLTHAGARRAAIVGLGSGVTLGSALTYPLEHLDVIEISREVVQASAWFGRENRQPLRDPRVRLIIGDARTHFRLGRGAQYDVIISEPSNPWMAGIAALFTREFFEELRARLAPGGLVCQWTHTYDISRADLQSIVATFAEVFPDLSMWLVGDGDLLLIGGRTEGSAGASRVTNARASPIVAANLGANGITSPRDLMAFYLADGFLARSWSRGAALQVDDRMALEFSAPGATVGVTREDNASELLSRAGSTLPEAPDDLRRAGLLLLNSNAPRRAWSYLSRAVPLLYDDREILAGYVKAAAATGRSPEAEHTLRALVEQRPTVTAARVEYARLLASRGELAGARVQLLSADRIAPGDPAVWEELAATAADAGNVEDLRTTLARLRSIPETPRTLYYAGVLHFLSGRAAEATVVARRAATADPSHAAAWNLLGASLGAAQGPPDEIRAAFARALAADPSDPASYVNLGTLDLQSARMAEAADWFAQALTLDSSNAAAREGLAATQRARRQP